MNIEQSAFVLHSRPYRETSALVTFFTPEYGKVNGVVRGVRGGRKTASQKTAMLQPFQQLTLQWREKSNSQTDLLSIQQIELANLRFPLQAEANICGLYVNELLYRLLFPQVATEALFDIYQQTLYQLLAAQQRSEQAWSLRQFEFQLLSELGHGLLCDQDVHQQTISAEATYQYYPQYGAVLSACDSQQQGVLIQGECLLALDEMRYCEHCLPQLKRLFRAILALYLGDKPIMTRELFN
ncbi:DNA repair protein RecO [Thiomicrorhabdus immobilis]|uniref:DNA repair protein RecO n=1 Tax=Thiomicrorhabdus immobilis TaxID=2791037 RepID=A0ABN6CWN1_9GAMM|nr:DNA repair protein RecO [Thiomicrorhabdus immobilis]BCN93159.1 DNA repair protein RecO [Thiomicrorhabdus immobilis]